MIRERPVVAITLGDPAGIGPEVVMGALQDGEVYAKAIPLVVGHAGLLRRCAEVSGVSAGDLKVIDRPSYAKGACGHLEVIHVETSGASEIIPGQISREAGLAANAYIRRACELALNGEVDAVATAPINKESLRLAGVSYIGHTEMLAAYLSSSDPLTLFITENMRIFFLSRHLSLREAIDFITAERMFDFIVRVNKAMIDLGFAHPRIGLAALNPHASDGGQFGDEEQKHLIPAAQKARDNGIDISDPIGADSVFNMNLEGRFDCVISLYHDQGHVAAKTRDFYGTVTATLGLPVLRTSVDHGTALDIAWKGIANPISMKRAILTAAEYSLR